MNVTHTMTPGERAAWRQAVLAASEERLSQKVVLYRDLPELIVSLLGRSGSPLIAREVAAALGIRGDTAMGCLRTLEHEGRIRCIVIWGKRGTLVRREWALRSV